MNCWLTKNGIADTKKNPVDVFWDIYPKVGIRRNRMSYQDVNYFRLLADSDIVLFKHPLLTIEDALRICNISTSIAKSITGQVALSMFMEYVKNSYERHNLVTIVTRITYNKEFVVVNYRIPYEKLHILQRIKTIDEILKTL